ncbi:MAG: hypothetical protein IJ033_02915 [Clostridia bacterium]|nr:hypothetical protein [Clostridia bacterium]
MNELIEFFKEMLLSKQNKWLIRRNESFLDLEVCSGTAHYDARTRTCPLCVALNNTIFLSNNMPNYRHPYCKCTYNEVYLNHIEIEFPTNKLKKYLFAEENKTKMIHSMGYFIEDLPFIFAKIYDAVEREFLKGNYKIKTLDKYGQRIAVFYTIEGKGLSAGKKFRCYTGCVVYPNGKLYVATPLVKDKEIKE